MIEILKFYVSGFWPWLGITCGLMVVVISAASVAGELVRTLVALVALARCRRDDVP